MRYYYIVDSLAVVKKAQAEGIISHYEFVGTQEQSVTHRSMNSEVLIMMTHTDHGLAERWENYPGVHHLGDPLDSVELDDAHMDKLQRFHPYRKNEAGKWHHHETKAVIDRKPHVREMMTQHVAKHFSQFKFRLYS